jgi:hypothetical protein
MSWMLSCESCDSLSRSTVRISSTCESISCVHSLITSLVFGIGKVTNRGVVQQSLFRLVVSSWLQEKAWIVGNKSLFRFGISRSAHSFLGYFLSFTWSCTKHVCSRRFRNSDYRAVPLSLFNCSTRLSQIFLRSNFTRTWIFCAEMFDFVFLFFARDVEYPAVILWLKR